MTSVADRGGACGRCLARAWLLARLAGHLDPLRARIAELIALPDRELIEAVAGRHRKLVTQEYERLEVELLRERCDAAGLEPLCLCDPRYPARLRAATAPPAVLHVGGGLERFCEIAAEDPVAVVGARRASAYGLEVARSLGHGLALAGVTLVSGIAFGIDSAAHASAVDAGGATIAVLPGGADRPYPRAKRALWARIGAVGAVVSELPPAAAVRRWMFPARNRIIAALSAMTVVVEGGERSGALITAAHARGLDRPVGAVPGRVTAPLTAGPHRLIAEGATLVRGAQDVLDALFGYGARDAAASSLPELAADLGRLLAAVGRGEDTVAALSRAGVEPAEGLAALSALELAGYIRREAGGRYMVISG